MSTEVCRGVPRPARIVEHTPSEGDAIGISRGDDRFRLLEIGDEPHGGDRHRHRLLDGAGEGYLIARPGGDLLTRIEPAARHVDARAAFGFECLRATHRSVPIGIGLDHGQGAGAAQLAGQLVVVTQGVQVDKGTGRAHGSLFLTASLVS